MLGILCLWLLNDEQVVLAYLCVWMWYFRWDGSQLVLPHLTLISTPTLFLRSSHALEHPCYSGITPLYPEQVFDCPFTSSEPFYLGLTQMAWLTIHGGVLGSRASSELSIGERLESNTGVSLWPQWLSEGSHYPCWPIFKPGWWFLSLPLLTPH